MSDLKPFEDLVKAVRREDAMRTDMECRARHMSVRVKEGERGNRFVLLARPRKRKGREIDGPVEVPFTDWGLKSLLAKRLRLPFDFVTRDLRAGLAQEVIDDFLNTRQDRAFRIRVRKDEGGWKALGVVNATFPRFSYGDLVDAFCVFASDMGMRLARYELDEKQLVGQLVFPDDVQPGGGTVSDPHRIGVWFKMSDVGYCAPRVETSILRLVCQNGMIGLGRDPLLHLKNSALHNISAHEAGQRIRERLVSMKKVSHEYLKILDRSRGKETLEATAGNELLRIMKLEKVPKKYLEYLVQAHRIESGKGPDARGDRWQMIQAFTRAAQWMEPELRETFERAAWNYVSAMN